MRQREQELNWKPLDMVQGHTNQQDKITQLTKQLIQAVADEVYISSLTNTNKHIATVDLTPYPTIVVEQLESRWTAMYPLDELNIHYANGQPLDLTLLWFNSTSDTTDTTDITE